MDKNKIFQAVRESKVDINADLKPQPMLLSSGEDWEGHPSCILGEGDYSVITGLSKSKKSFFKSMIIASYINGDESNIYAPFKTHRKEDKIILDIDTEQSDFHAQRTFKRVSRIIGSDYKYHKCYVLRPYSATERLQILETLIDQYGDRIGLISLDGYIDFVERFNDEKECTEFQQKLMTWTNKYPFHITGVLHQNPSGEKMIGHIGSIVERKASSIMKLVRDPENKLRSVVVNERGRDAEFDDFEVEIRNGLLVKLQSDDVPF